MNRIMQNINLPDGSNNLEVILFSLLSFILTNSKEIFHNLNYMQIDGWIVGTTHILGFMCAMAAFYKLVFKKSKTK